MRASPAHRGVLFNPNNVGETLLIEPREPFFSYKFAVHGEGVDVFCWDDFEELFHQSDPLFLIGISPFAFLWQDFPHDRDRDLADDDREDEEVDRFVTELPVGSIEGEEVAVLGFWNALKNESTDGEKAKIGAQKEVLESSVAALIGARASIFGGGELDEIDAAMLHRRGD